MMKAILLAAGVGSRITEDIGMMPKSLLDVGGKPLIIHTVELLKKNNIEVIVITGFKHRMLDEALEGYDVKIYYNPFYRVTNSIGSLWYAEKEFLTDEDIMIANADVYYTEEMIDRILSADYDEFLLEDKTRADSGDYYFKSKNCLLQRFGKELRREERNSEYVGIAVLKGKWIRKFHDRLCLMIENGQYDLWWENVLYSFVGSEDIHTVDVDGIFWSEVDTIEDYQRVLKHISTDLN